MDIIGTDFLPLPVFMGHWKCMIDGNHLWG